MGTIETYQLTSTKLNRITWLSERDFKKEFHCLMHLFNEESLTGCFHELDAKKAVGIDGINKAMYGKDLIKHIKDLTNKMKNMAYRPSPVKEVLIPKEGKPGATRPLGISILEDKIVQSMMQKVLESIYEPLFLECSFGFRPGKSCHDAIKALTNHLFKNDTQTVIDIDLKNFFGTIDHELLKQILETKIKDTRFIRYISRMFKAGVLAEGELIISEEGVPQGSLWEASHKLPYAK
jgi:RNA-directed DNA polymerase